ncbi:MotA/TolQ/ExbB proton channel family protein [Rubinisphaera italica]|uniref:MotA/TolQ/ExbB proton channel family protein n=1 Tax=Rubinisphaera italica TaxID=2527969 RepID=A0A5C5XND5_9PLAN|nr:MotA/TolQ/ExbB proton channel family protein [Rubinisphaera italica]TWT63991.1 MotA/TolQ/ExbB proton channel family protein [Rubinisphaera italica]
MNSILSAIAELSTWAISVAACFHLAVFAVLVLWSRRDMKILTGTLQDYTRDLRQRSVLDPTAHLTEQMDAFIADIEDVVSDPSRKQEQQLLRNRMNLLDEKRRYLHALKFETIANTARTMIEAYPLAGVLGTIVSIGAALNAPGSADTETVSLIVARFGDAIWSTFAGLSAALVLLFVNSLLEPAFQRLSETRSHIRSMISTIKSRLGETPASE